MANLLLKSAARAARALPPGLRQALYRLGPLTRWIRALLNRAAPQGLIDVRIAAGAAEGLAMRLDLQREKDYWLGTYEGDLQEMLHTFLRPGMVVYDVGANIGYLSLAFARAVGERGEVFAFEALPGNVARLRENADRNGFSARLHIVQTAVVNQTGRTTFLVHHSHGMGKAAGSAGRAEPYDGQIEIDGTSIDTFIFDSGHTRPDLIKMDIEGGEVLALNGMARTLTEIRPVVFLELHGEEAARAAWEAFDRAAYTLHRMDTDLPRIRSLAELDWKAYVIALPGTAP